MYTNLKIPINLHTYWRNRYAINQLQQQRTYIYILTFFFSYINKIKALIMHFFHEEQPTYAHPWLQFMKTTNNSN